MLSPAHRSSIFDMTLDHLMHHQQSLNDDCDIPRILLSLTENLLATGLEVEGMWTFLYSHFWKGLFRIPGSTNEVFALKLAMEKGIYGIPTSVDTNAVASLLKLWLRELPDPIIPSSLYDDCLACAAKNDYQGSCNVCLSQVENFNSHLKIIQKLPEINKRVVLHLVSFLRKLTAPKVVEKTKMTVDNLSMVFAPSFLRCSEDNPTLFLIAQQQQKTFVMHLIEHL